MCFLKSKKDKIIILKVTKYSDNHLIVTGLNPMGSKISLMAPAALKSRKRFGGGVLEPTHFIEIHYELPKSDGDRLPILKEAHIIEAFDGLRDDFDKLTLAFYFLKIIDYTIQEEVPDSDKVFALVGHALKGLSKAKDLNSFKIHFEIKYLFTQGVLELDPELERYLKARFSDYLTFSKNFTESLLYQKIKNSLEDYTGLKSFSPGNLNLEYLIR